MKKVPEVNLNTSQKFSLPDLDSKDSDEDWKTKQCMTPHLLDKDFGDWHDKRISEDLHERDKCDKMTCDHADPCKEAKCPDPLGLPLEYMVSNVKELHVKDSLHCLAMETKVEVSGKPIQKLSFCPFF